MLFVTCYGVHNLEASIQVRNASVSAMHLLLLSQVVDARQAELYIGTS